MVKKQILGKVKKYRLRIEKEGIPVEKILIYGSHVRGTAREDSDIDVCVVSKSFGEDRFEERLRLVRLVRDIDLRLEPVAFSLKDFKTNKTSPLLHQIKKEGVEVK